MSVLPIKLTKQRVGLAVAPFAFSLLLLGCESETIGQLTVSGSFEPATLAFGQVAVNRSKNMPSSLVNKGSAPLEITDIELPANFTLLRSQSLLMSEMIPVGAKLDLEFQFLPTEVGPKTGRVVLFSGSTEFVLNVSGEGVVPRLPELVLEPASIDFGAVEVNGESTRTVRIVNNAEAEGVITGITAESGGAHFRTTTGMPVRIAPQSRSEVTLVFRPDAARVFQDKLALAVTGTDGMLLDVRGEGVVPTGDIVCSPSTIAFGAIERGLSADRDVTCTARGGAARLVSATISGGDAMQFGLINPPATRDLGSNDSVTIKVQYAPDGLPAMHGANLAVAYSGGNGPGTVNVPLNGELIPPAPTTQAISVIMRWGSPQNDVDIHMIRPGGAVFENTDVYFGNRQPDWGVAGDMTDNPYLDVDDTDGYGPETINLGAAPAGAYKIYAHFWSDDGLGSTEVTAEVYVAGQLARPAMTRRMNCDELWEIGTVNWDGRNGTFVNGPSSNGLAGRGVCF